MSNLIRSRVIKGGGIAVAGLSALAVAIAAHAEGQTSISSPGEVPTA